MKSFLDSDGSGDVTDDGVTSLDSAIKLKSSYVDQLKLKTQDQKTRNLSHPTNQAQNILVRTSSNLLSPMSNRNLDRVNTIRDSNFKLKFMNSKSVEQSARLRKRIDDIHTRNKIIVKDKHKILGRNRMKLNRFQKSLMSLGNDPQSPMSRRKNPGDYFNSPSSARYYSVS